MKETIMKFNTGKAQMYDIKSEVGNNKSMAES
jgi:hypothetical protein